MDFAVMGTISSYVRQKNLTFAAKHKIRTGQTLTDAYGNWSSTRAVSTFDKLREAANASKSQAKAQKLARIKRKLRDGQKLSDEELGFLRVNDPKTYKKAKHADEAREELKAELRKAKSKSEAQEAMSRAMVKASAEAMAELGAIGSGGAVQAGSSGGGAAMSTGGEVSSDVGGEVSATGGEVAAMANSGEVATSTEGTATANDPQKTSAAQKNSDADNFTPEDIMEKFIWTIRALEDEWSRFTDSDEYKSLPNQLADEVTVKVHVPDKKFLRAMAAYRKAMNFANR